MDPRGRRLHVRRLGLRPHALHPERPLDHPHLHSPRLPLEPRLEHPLALRRVRRLRLLRPPKRR
jgi:hypothetical protein